MSQVGHLEVKNLRKEYPGTVAVDNFSNIFTSGQIHALIGKNGSGKSTVINMLSGVILPTKGGIFLNNKPVVFKSPIEAMKQGIATVHQEMSLVPELTVAENICLGRWCQKGIAIDWAAVHAQAVTILAKVDPTIDPNLKVKALSVGQQQIVEIAKAMSNNPSILILDEPTSALASAEVTKLFVILKNLRSQGITQIYVSHRLQELHEIADTVTVLRDGIFVDHVPMAQADHKKILSMMFGEIKLPERRVRPKKPNEPLLSVRNLSRNNKFNHISFELHKGEIIGIAGMLGSGRTEILRAIFGIDKFDQGELLINNRVIEKPTPELMKKQGVAYASEDRKHEGLVQIASTHTNLIMAAMQGIAKKGYLTSKMETPYVTKQIKDLEIKVPSTLLPVSSLSGGNQQKVVVGNWLNTEPKIILCDEPSRGVDVEAKQHIFEILWQQSLRGISSIVVSTELEELLDICDRILILRKGSITGEYLASELTATTIYEKAMEN